MSILVAPETALRETVVLDTDLIDVVEEAYTWLATREVVMPPIMQIENPEVTGQTCIKSALVSGQGGFAAKLSSLYPGNAARGLVTNSGLMVLMDGETGHVRAVLLDNGYLTELRTAAGGAVAARHLAPASIECVGVLGAGRQARAQAQALALERSFSRLLCWSRDRSRAEALAAWARESLGVEASAASAEEAVVSSDVVLTTTSAREPILRAEWLHPKLHISAIGSDAPEKNELAPAVLARADRYVCDSERQVARLGELHHALEAGLEDELGPCVELGEITSGRRPGREDEREITVCDLTGVGVQDTAIAAYAARRLEETGLGERFA